ncbi:MAG: hypothetical protein U1E60_08780 [Reyranellaceae bacterium]
MRHEATVDGATWSATAPIAWLDVFALGLIIAAVTLALVRR